MKYRAGRSLTMRSARGQVPVVAGVLARALDSGATLPVAVADSAQLVDGVLGEELDRVSSAISRGVPVVSAFEEWAAASVVDDVELFAVAVRASAGHGGDLAAAFDAVCLTVSDRLAAAEEARAMAAQARASAMTLAALPVVGAGVFCLLDPAVLRTLCTTAVGWACLVIGSSLNVVGALLMRRMVAGALR